MLKSGLSEEAWIDSSKVKAGGCGLIWLTVPGVFYSVVEMKAWSRSQYERPPTDAELISTYLQQAQAQQQQQQQQVSQQQGQPYGVPIPPPLVPDDHTPLPPPRSSSSSAQPSSSRSKGKRSRHSAGNGRSSGTSSGGDIHYPKYDIYKYDQQPSTCQYNTKYGEDCHYSKHTAGKECDYNKTWPKQQHYPDDPNVPYTQDDAAVQYVQEQYAAEQAQLREQEALSAKYAQVRKKQAKEAASLKQAVAEQRLKPG